MNDLDPLDIPRLLRALIEGRPVAPAALERALTPVLSGEGDDVQVAGLLVALAARPPRAELLAAAARVLRQHALAVPSRVRPLIDTCGTGGDGAGTFNISTAAALVVAAAGAAVAKHGNRGVSSRVGSADVLGATGAVLELNPQQARRALEAVGFAFLYAPAFHPAMAHVANVRRRLGVRTLFNLLGPLVNPAGADYQLIGVYDASLTRVMAETLAELGSRGALVVHCAGVDEIGLHDVTVGHRVRDGRVEPFALDPRDHGLALQPLEALRGGNAAENATSLGSVLSGETGTPADVVALNAAAALEVAGVVPDLDAGLELARARLADGRALDVLERYVAMTRRESTREAG